MRLSQARRSDIEDEIIKDLYDPPQKKIDNKKGALVIRNHTEWVKPLMPIINQLPDGMIHSSETLRMEIPEIPSDEIYTKDINTPVIDDTLYSHKCDKSTWTQYVDSSLPVMMKGSGWQSNDLPVPLQKSMKEEVIKLRIEDFKLKIERINMKKYLRDTLDRNNTTSKLRKAFPSTLQKYIPPEPPRAARQPKPINTEETPELIVPGNLKQRMTENLLDN